MKKLMSFNWVILLLAIVALSVSCNKRLLQQTITGNYGEVEFVINPQPVAGTYTLSINQSTSELNDFINSYNINAEKINSVYFKELHFDLLSQGNLDAFESAEVFIKTDNHAEKRFASVNIPATGLTHIEANVDNSIDVKDYLKSEIITFTLKGKTRTGFTDQVNLNARLKMEVKYNL